MPPALQLSHNSDSEDEKVMTRQSQAQVRQPPEAGELLFMVEDDSEGYGEEDEDDDDNEDGGFLMKPTLATQTAVNRPLDQLNGNTLYRQTTSLLTTAGCPQIFSRVPTWISRRNTSVMSYGRVSSHFATIWQQKSLTSNSRADEQIGRLPDG